MIIYLYITLVSIIAFMMMGIDKWKAKNHRWRISEKALMGIAIIGGSVGSIIGMYVFRHKTKHLHFKIGLPVILIIQIVVLKILAL